MSVVQIDDTADIESKINEAEVYYSMGLLVESLGVYEHALSLIAEDDVKNLEKINNKIDLLKQEIENQEKVDTKALSPEDISIIKQSLTSSENTSAILDSATAFKELGLHQEAIAEFEKLFKTNYSAENAIFEIAECLFHIHSPSKVLKRIEAILKEKGINKEEKAKIRLNLGIEMEKRGHNDLSLELFQSAKDAAPENEDIKTELESKLASISTGSKYDYLLTKKRVTTDQLKKALLMSKKMKKSVEFILIENFRITREEEGKSLSLFYGYPFRGYNEEIPTPLELISNLKMAFLLQDIWVPLSWNKKGVEILIDDPSNLSKIDNIKVLVKTKKPIFSIGIKEDIEKYIKRFFEEKKTGGITMSEDGDVDDFDLIPDVSFEEEEEPEDDSDEIDATSSKVVKLVDQFIITAYRKNASDIHIEPSPITKVTSIRFRIDGVCQDYLNIPNVMARGVLSRLKIMSALDIAERRLPQDGKIKFRRKGIPPFEMRLATLPTTGGFEDAVLRILATAGAMKIDEMGLSERNYQVLGEIIKMPYGLILAVGPTGSGKTTTLHSALGYINKPTIKIWTAEDPVEITQPGLRQVEAKPQIGLDFARIMRAFLRADPDVIMIGEMRDEETSSIGVEASLTGHLVFSTLHTNSAPETVTRLLDMGLNPLNFSDAILGILAQRLVRRLCTKCRQEYHPTKEEFDEIVVDYGEEFFSGTGFEYTSDLKLFRTGNGCEDCSNTGYRGRVGIHELMEGTESIKRMIKKEAETHVIKEQALKDGMTTLKQDGIMKVFQGITDISEVRRVCIN